MTPRELVCLAIDHRSVPYTPWQIDLTSEPRAMLEAHFATGDLDRVMGNHLLQLGHGAMAMVEQHDGTVEDLWGVRWDRSQDQDIGQVANCLLPEPVLSDLRLPDPADPRIDAGCAERVARHGDAYRIWCIGFSLYERAWTLRGMDRLLMDFHDHPEFVRGLLRTIADWNLACLDRAIDRWQPDAVYFGDDWGSQRGLIMGHKLWSGFIRPELERMYRQVRQRGRRVVIHSCGKVDALFGDLVELGLSLFNPFQPEVIDVPAACAAWRGKLAFWGGLSTQRTLPRGSPDDVRAEANRLIALGRSGGVVAAPAHAVEGDVPLVNLLALIETFQAQPGWRVRGRGTG